MKKTALFLNFFLLSVSVTLLASPYHSTVLPRSISFNSETYTDNAQKLALEGYDPVSYFNHNGPEIGLASYSFFWKGANWRFSSQENQELFQKNPEKYAPQYGGYCPWALSQGYLEGGIPHVWHIKEGKLYLLSSSQALQKWQEDGERFNRIADARWFELNS